MTGRPERAHLRIAPAPSADADSNAAAHANARTGRRARDARPDDPALPARTEAEYQWGTSPDIPLEALYARYAPYVAAIAMRILGRESEVEDLVQDVFATAVRGLRRRHNHAEIKRWLATVTVRRSIRRLRVLALWSWVNLDEEASWERVAHVYRALDRLPIRDRVAWVLRHVEGESLQQVADLCGCSLATVKRRIARAQARISVAIEGRPRRGS
jgi:RNA polymerase sigma-70 factor (ECF subfamily)